LCAEVALAVRYRKFEQQILQTSKLASLGTLAAGIAHEIRNPLSSIKTFVQLLPTRPNDAEFQAEFSQLVSNDVDRITKIVENVLSFARSTSLNVTEQRIEAIIEDSLTLIKSKLKHGNVELTTHFDNLPPVRVDKDQMSQVIVNIVLNAVEALPQQGGKIKITCSTSLLESPRSGRRRKTPHMTIEIADNGPGIPDNIKSRLFDPFFTTKPVGVGTGMGLAVAKQILTQHDGNLELTNRPTGGVQATVTFHNGKEPNHETDRSPGSASATQ
jgi:signal transduction histidine kinase